jgi:TPP-dependent pyruvate/acetoin dehydrogenase alpha subunit
VSGGDSIAARAQAFGLLSFEVDGQDVGAVYRAVTAARERALAGDGPTFIEALTYRYYGHNTGEQTAYRTQEELDEWRDAKDPIARLRFALESEGLLGASEFEEVVAAQKQIVADAIAAAEASPLPDPATVADGVYGLPVVRRGNPS